LLFGSHKKESGGEGDEQGHQDGHPDLHTTKRHTPALQHLYRITF